MSIVFDKLSFTRKLEVDGVFSRPQAERLSDAFHDAVRETVATKDDMARLEDRMQSLETRIESRMQSLESRLDSRMQSLEARSDASLAQLKVWISGVGVALFSALAAIRFFGH